MTQPSPMRAVLPPIHRQGWPFIAIFLVAALLLGWLWEPLFWLGLIATAWCAYFFRDPVRVTPDDPSLVVSPADGVVVGTHARVPPPELEMGTAPLPCVAVFMNVFDVHVNRYPVDGTVQHVVRTPGKFLNAMVEASSDDNEQASVGIVSGPHRILVRQIAGLIARRIITDSANGDVARQGSRMGLIRFGSRVDVFLPPSSELRVAIGQRTQAGVTVIAELPRT